MQKLAQRIIHILFLASALLTVCTSVLAQPGSLDPTFSDDGKLTDGTGSATAVVIQPDGRIVVVGSQNGDFAVARYHSDGSPDTTFGGSGRVSTSFGPDMAAATAVAIQQDGKIVVSGYACPCDDFGAAAFAVARYNIGGSPDLSFDGDGKVLTEMGGPSTAQSILIQTDNKIIVAGYRWAIALPYYKEHFALTRYEPDGSLDTTFGVGGKITTSFCGNCNDEALAVALQPDGKIVAVGGGFDGTFNTRFYVVRYNGNGTLDTSFDSDGWLMTSFGVGAWAKTVAIQEDGKIVAGGAGWSASVGFILARYNANGSLDTTFDSDGQVTTPVGGPDRDTAESLVIQPDGKIVGTGGADHGPNTNFALVRYNTDGSLDTTFGGGDGTALEDFDGADDRAVDMALDGHGRMVAVGVSAGKFAIARFLGDSPVVSPLTISGRVTTPDGQAVRGAPVSLIDSADTVRTTTTSSFGLYSFDEVSMGASYTITVRSRRYRFAPRTLTVNGSLTGVDLVGLQ